MVFEKFNLKTRQKIQEEYYAFLTKEMNHTMFFLHGLKIIVFKKESIILFMI